MLENKPRIGDTCCASREMTVQEILEHRRAVLIEELKKTEDAIREIQHINPNMEKALKVILAFGANN